ncbi:sigma-70 family RNA polymerase sigma factor [Kitasatospora sp. CB02891]|uniref:sigma-70 family RNA polymerase sigma factor n=1 Tax=Kitasatospora sp. CB02891 TaxID=2020329 RepID=UPI000C27A2F6|nr:sigma-70 family RNA polymerase sigma factor [Kitasatospora sp. CB02891]PJN28059.1 RNA polymerase [Kitasatospora sp. CB02891]
MDSGQVATLVGRAQHGDRQAVAELVGGHLPLVYNVVGRALSGHPDTDDVVQETMLRAVDGLSGLRDPAGFRSWLVAIALNQVRRRFRDEDVEGAARQMPDPVAVADPAADFVGLTIVRLGLSEQRREVAEATRWLDEGDRDLLALWWLEAAGELSRAELAAALEVSPQHAAVRVQRMKGQLEAARVAVRALAAVPVCTWLAELTAGWDGVPSALWRKRIGRHVRECAGCGEHRRGLMPAEGLLAGLAMVPLPDSLAALPLEPAGSAQGAVPHRRGPADGGPRGGSHRAGSRHGRRAAARRGPQRVLVGGGVVVTVAVGLLVAVGLPESSSTTGAPEAARQPAAAGPEQVEALAVPAGGTAPSPSAAPSSSASPSAKPSASASPSASVAGKAPSATASPRSTSTPAAKRMADLGQQVLDLVNSQRAQAGCKAVRANGQLTAAAQEQSDDMAERAFFDHTNPDGEGPEERIDAAGYQWSGWGENIARGQKDAAAVMAGWMNSPGHRANILNCAFTELGVGVHQGTGGPWWTQDFGTPG